MCGDWYDVVDLPPDRYAAAVGDVVGHGLHAAAVMGMLRSALSAVIRATPSPAQALEVLGLYARSMEGATAATAVKVLVDTRSRLIIYSSAGHPPPVLLHTDGTCELLDRATDPPLGTREHHVPRPQAGVSYQPGDTLVLYTDDELRSISVPVTLVVGERTEMFDTERMVERARSLFPHVTTEVVPGAGHALTVSHADLCASRVSHVTDATL